MRHPNNSTTLQPSTTAALDAYFANCTNKRDESRNTVAHCLNLIDSMADHTVLPPLKVTNTSAHQRAFYTAVRAFVNDPATWAQIDAQEGAGQASDEPEDAEQFNEAESVVSYLAEVINHIVALDSDPENYALDTIRETFDAEVPAIPLHLSEFKEEAGAAAVLLFGPEFGAHQPAAAAGGDPNETADTAFRIGQVYARADHLRADRHSLNAVEYLLLAATIAAHRARPAEIGG